MEKIENAIRKKLYEIAVHTFELTCFMFPLEEWEVGEDDIKSENKSDAIKSIVQFEGAAKGALVLSASANLANSIAANMLGIEEASKAEKEHAVTEIANIICGNLVPLFANNNDICFIRPPRVLLPNENMNLLLNMNTETIQLILNEGVADISIFYSEANNDD